MAEGEHATIVRSCRSSVSRRYNCVRPWSESCAVRANRRRATRPRYNYRRDVVYPRPDRMRFQSRDQLNCSAPSGAAIRDALRAYLLAKNAKDSDSVVIEELGLSRGHVRVDIALVNGRLHGYEIKSDRDSLRRLSRQVELYSKVFDRATLVVGDRFAAHAKDAVPDWWGLLHARRASSGFHFRTLRRCRLNPERDIRVLAELLWANEALRLLNERNVARGARGKPRRVLWERICQHYGLEEVAQVVRQNLKARIVSRALA
jgi:biotin operon repressor